MQNSQQYMGAHGTYGDDEGLGRTAGAATSSEPVMPAGAGRSTGGGAVSFAHARKLRSLIVTPTWQTGAARGGPETVVMVFRANIAADKVAIPGQTVQSRGCVRRRCCSFACGCYDNGCVAPGWTAPKLGATHAPALGGNYAGLVSL
jgi:hypothetical protein